MAVPTLAVQMCFATPLRQKLIDSGCAALWPLDDAYGDTVRELVAGRTGAAGSVSRNDPGLLPEYGTSSTFSGASSIVVTSASWMASSTAVAVAAVVRLEAVGVAQTIIHRNSHFLLNITAANVVEWGCYIAGTFRSVSYTIASTADWLANPRVLVGRYTGAALQLYEITAAGAVNQLASSTTWTGSAAPASALDLEIGRANGTAFLRAAMQCVAFWVDDYPTDADLAHFATSLVWTDITADVHEPSGLEFQWGIQSSGASQRVANTGTLQFSLRNDASNSGGSLGYYSLDHANRRTGFDFGNPVRLRLTDPDTNITRTRWAGRLDDITPAPGRAGTDPTRCVAVDYIDELAQGTLPAVPFSSTGGDDPSGVRMDEAIGKLLSKFPVTPHFMTGSGWAEVFPYGTDRARSRSESPMGEFARIADSELGYVYLRSSVFGGMQLTLEGRHARALKTTPDFTFTTDLRELEVGRRRSDIVTRTQVTVHPRHIDTSTSVLYALEVQNSRPALAAGQSLTIRADYTDATERGNRIGGTELVAPVASTDYTASATDAVSGTDQTASLSVAFVDENGQAVAAADVGADGALLKLTNTGLVTIYVTKLQIRGKAVRTYEPVTCEHSDPALRRQYGDNVLVVDQAYQDDVARGNSAALMLLAAYSTPRTGGRRMVFRAGNDSPASLLTAACAVDCGDLVRISETVTGLSSADYFVNGVSVRVSGRYLFDVTLQLVRREQQAWIFGVAGRSEFGESTVMGF